MKSRICNKLKLLKILKAMLNKNVDENRQSAAKTVSVNEHGKVQRLKGFGTEGTSLSCFMRVGASDYVKS